MRIGPFELSLAPRTPTTDILDLKTGGNNLITPWPYVGGNAAPGGWWPIIKESFAGAWQRGIVASVEDAASHPTFWACITLIAGDIAKCRPRLMEAVTEDGILEERAASPLAAVLKKPNHYQNRIQFYTYWILCKLTRGNAYALKERDARGVVVALYLLDPTRVRPLVGPTGDVFYALGQDVLSGVTSASTVVPASEIIHDSMNTLFHPLVGLSPVYACGTAALQGLAIVNNATNLFRRGSLVGGILTAPGQISPENQQQIEAYWAANFAGESNIGKVAVLGNGLKFEKPPVMSAVDAQLIEQLKWDDEKICAVLHVPPYKVAVGPLPSYNNVEALGQDYYGQCLQTLFESLELCLTEGLELEKKEVEFDLEALDRMDSAQRMDVATKGVVGGVFKPNEARRKFNLKPVEGGDRVYLQQQNWPLNMLGTDLPKTPDPAPPADPEDDDPEDEPDDEETLAVDWVQVRALVERGLSEAA